MQHPRSGFSLLEFVVVTGIIGVITVHILGIFSSQLQNYESQKATVETQSTARLASDLVFRDVRMAGFMVPQTAGVSGVDGGPGGSDILCLSDPTVLDDVQVELAVTRFPGAGLGANLGVSGSMTLTAAGLDVDGDGDVDFAEDSGIIIVDGTNTHCARITTLNAGTGGVVFSPPTTGTFAANVGSARAIPAVIYELTAAGLTRNTLVISRQVEDFQVEYGIDADNDAQLAGAEFPVNGVNGANPSLVRLVRLSILTRTVREDPNLPGTGRPALANRTAGAQDDFRRRLVRVSAAPRNVL